MREKCRSNSSPINPPKYIKLLKQKIKLVKQLRELKKIKPLQNLIAEWTSSNQTKKRPQSEDWSTHPRAVLKYQKNPKHLNTKVYLADVK